MARYKYTRNEVIKWAEDYLFKVSSLENLEKEIGIPHSTLWWSFTYRLPFIDPQLSRAVNAKLVKNSK